MGEKIIELCSNLQEACRTTLLDDLLKQQVFMRDPMGMPETRLRASALLCKAFMQFEAREGQTADIRVLWIQVLDLLDRLMHVDRRDQLVRGRSALVGMNDKWAGG